MSNVGEFSVAFWFLRESDRTADANQTNHNVDNVMLAKSGASTNDVIEIGSSGSDLEIYLDTTATADPGEVTGLRFASATTMEWDDTAA